MYLLTCKEFLEGLNDYLEQTLDSEERQHLQKHVDECPNCWVVVDTTRKTLQVYKGMEPQEIPPEVHERLMTAVEKKIASHTVTK